MELRGRVEGIFLNPQRKAIIIRTVGDTIGHTLTATQMEELSQEMLEYCASVDTERRVEMCALARAELLEYLLPEIVSAAGRFLEEEGKG